MTFMSIHILVCTSYSCTDTYVPATFFEVAKSIDCVNPKETISLGKLCCKFYFNIRQKLHQDTYIALTLP